MLPREITLELIDHLEEVELADGQDAVRAGEAADALYLVQDGRLGVWIAEDEAPRRVRTLHSGEFFGERALILGTTRTATVRAEGPVRLLRLTAARFGRLMAESPVFAARVRERMTLYEARDSQAAPDPRGTAEAQADDSVWSAADPGLSVTETGAADQAVQPRRRRRGWFVRQVDEMDCGAACVAMLCRYFGHNVSMASIRSAVGTDLAGTSLRGLVRGGEEVGLRDARDQVLGRPARRAAAAGDLALGGQSLADRCTVSTATRCAWPIPRADCVPSAAGRWPTSGPVMPRSRPRPQRWRQRPAAASTCAGSGRSSAPTAACC